MAYAPVGDGVPDYRRLHLDASGSARNLLKDDIDDGLAIESTTTEYVAPQVSSYSPCSPTLSGIRDHLTRAALGWLTPHVWKAFRGKRDDSSAFVYESQSCLTDSLRLWQLMRGAGPKGSLGRCAWFFCRGRILAASLLGAVAAFASVASPALLMAGLIHCARGQDSKDVDAVPVVLWITGLTVCELVACLLHAGSFSIASREAGRLRAAIQGLLYRKMLRLNGCSELRPHQAEFVVLSEPGAVAEFCQHAPEMVTAPLLVVLSLSAACILVGESAIAAATVYIITLVVQLFMARHSAQLRARAQAVFSRWRVQRTHELLAYAHHAKVFVMESALVRRIKELRRAESASLRLVALLDNAGRFLLPYAVPAVAVALALHPTFGASRQLAAHQVFPVLVLLLVQMESALRGWNRAVHALFRARSSLARLKVYLSMDEAQPRTDPPIDRLVAVCFNSASFAWATSSSLRTEQNAAPRRNDPALNRLSIAALPLAEASVGPTPNALTAIHIVVNKGRLVGVCGRQGAGKSALLLAALGQLRLTAGHLSRDESVAYVGPEPELLPGTLRDNVTMNGPLVSNRYYRAMHSSGLEHDVNALSAGEDTLVDSSRLSRAQQQRLVLARTIYAEKEIYLLDDPLSAMDTNTAEYIFEKAILEGLRGRTVIIATNREQHLSKCNEVYVLREGRVLERGAPEDLAESGREYRQVLETDNVEEQWWAPSCPGEVVRDAERDRPRDGDEEDVAGSGAWREIHALLEDCSSGTGSLLLLLAPLTTLAICTAAIPVFPWLALKAPEAPARGFLAMFLVFASTVVALTFARSFLWAQRMLGMSRQLHDAWIERLGRSTIAFLRGNTPKLRYALADHTWLPESGLARSMASLGLWLQLGICEIVLLGMFAMWGALPVIFVFLPVAVFLTIVACVSGDNLWQRYRERAGPLGLLVRASLPARASILALGREDDLVAQFAHQCDATASSLVVALAVPAWLTVRLRAALALVAFVGLVMMAWPLPPAEPVSVSLGLCATLLLLMSSHIPRAAAAAVRARACLTSAVSARDLIHRAELEEEEPVVDMDSASQGRAVWQSEGDGGLALRDVWRPPELRALTARVAPGECVGVVGPPAAELSNALLRFTRPTAGCILVNGTDINDLPLQLLRTAVIVVPPRPAVFSGSLRWNLDPHGIWSDAQLWEALDRSGAREAVSALDRKLLTPLGGAAPGPLSLEDVQLLCLARARLREPAKVVVLEAPAGPRVLTYARRLFPECAILVAGRGQADVVACGSVLQTPR